MLCGTAMPAVTYDGGGNEIRALVFSGMTRLATLLLPLGSAKLAEAI